MNSEFNIAIGYEIKHLENVRSSLTQLNDIHTALDAYVHFLTSSSLNFKNKKIRDMFTENFNRDYSQEISNSFQSFISSYHRAFREL